jgi:Fe(3+) dicitrate transport protein
MRTPAVALSFGLPACMVLLAGPGRAAGEPAPIVIEEEDGEEQRAPAPQAAAPSDAKPAPLRRALTLSQIDVIGDREEALEVVPGSAAVITKTDLQQQAPLSANEALRMLPGVTVIDEDGIGLRPNIGIRGLNPDRSRNILILEDGVPIALAPYGEPEMYYNPRIERMQRLELVKGSGSILYGPQTIGGVLNYVTLDPPDELSVFAEARAGTHGYYSLEAGIGETVGQVGYRLSVMHQRFAGHRGLNLEVTDVTGKLRLQLTSNSYLNVKGQVYDESSSATYLGLTQQQFETDPSFNFAVHDRLPVRRYAFSVNHNILLGSSFLVQTTAYANHTVRDWQRQDFDRSDGGRSYERIIDGTGKDITDTEQRPDDGSAVYFRNSTGNRNRAFTIAGVESRATHNTRVFSWLSNELIFGARLHTELAEEQRLDGSFASAKTGALREDEARFGLAGAAFAQNRVTLFDRLRVSPGLRVEALQGTREVFRARRPNADGNQVPTDLDPAAKESTEVFALIPGLGVSYGVLEGLTLFAGVHRGFAPPRTKDAVTSDGTNLELEAEYSWDYELGLRGRLGRVLFGEVTGFFLDFQNQIIPPTEAGGAIVNNPDLAGRPLVNAGQTRHLGVESSVIVDLIPLTGLDFSLPIGLTYTFVRAEYGEGWNEDLAGKVLPYAPAHNVAAFARFVHPIGFSTQVTGHYMSEQFTDTLNTVAASPDGLVGVIPSRFVLDARVGYTWRGITAYALGKNLLDERYIANRAPQGIQPGMFRQFIVGLRGEI